MMFNINEKNLLYIFVVIFVISISIVYCSIDNHAEIEANKRIETILEQHKALHSYIENVQKPVIYNLKAEGKLYEEWFDPKILSFTYIARNIHDNYKNAKKSKNEEYYHYKLASNNPRNPINLATSQEKSILSSFNKKEITEFNTVLKENDKTYFYKALPISPNKGSCMLCHSSQEIAPKEMVKMYGNGGYHENIGDIRAMISLKIPITEILKEAQNHFLIISSLILILMVSFYFLLIRIIKQKKLLQIEITKNRNKDALIAQQNKMIALDDMIGNVAHQWRQPLSVITTVASGCKFEKEIGLLKDDELLNRLDVINSTAQNMSKTIDDFRDYLKGDLKKVKFNLTEEIYKCLVIEKNTLDEGRIQVLNSLDDMIDLNSFPHALSQALINLINNAKEALIEIKDENKRLIFIDTKRNNDNIIITLKDSGNGIPKNIMERIFEPYFTTKHQAQGTGLGLHITYQLITDKMGGNISVSNQTYKYEGKQYSGAEFTISLPFHKI